MPRILVVDDEASIRGVLHQLFEYEGHEVTPAESGADALAKVTPGAFDVAFLDVKMPGMDGIEALEGLRRVDPTLQVVMISGHATIDTALEATRRGAFDFLQKPLDTNRLLVTLRNVLERKALEDSMSALRTEEADRHRLVGASPALQALLERIERVAPTDARVLITGENGTGKELVARAIHRHSRRSAAPFVEVNCAAIPSELIESELFGHMKGSFTGAVRDRAGTFEQAHGGTLFLDEIGDMALAAQAKVLRALEEGRITRVGGGETRAVDVRVVAATNKDLQEEIQNGRFREDLFYRLNVVPIEVPPLRDRREDIPLLVEHFLKAMASREGVKVRPIEVEAMDLLTARSWPGNIRELRNTVERLLILSSGESIGAADVRRLVGSEGAMEGGALPEELLSAPTLAAFREEAERLYLLHKLRAQDWNVSETARALEVPRSNLYKKMERFGLERDA
jgi:two-component system, NtrC family, nitrogen regulation response regulator NtrX